MINEKDEVVFKHGYAIELITTENNNFLELTLIDEHICIITDNEVEELKNIIKRYEKVKLDRLLQQDISILSLDRVTESRLKEKRINTVRQLVSLTISDVKNLISLESYTIGDIRNKLNKKGLELGMNY